MGLVPMTRCRLIKHRHLRQCDNRERIPVLGRYGLGNLFGWKRPLLTAHYGIIGIGLQKNSRSTQMGKERPCTEETVC